MEQPRKCENWLQTFGKWMLPISEAPSSFIMWTGLFVLASVLRRKIHVPKELLGRWSADPNLYIFFVGDAGRVRKTTTMGGAQELLDAISDLTASPEIITKEDILKKLVESNDASMYIFSPEFSEFITKSGPSMFSFLTNIYDGKKNISSSTISRGLEYAEKPCVNLLAATTPVWIAENMSEAIIGGGFASRVVFIYEDEVRQRKMFYRNVLQEMGSELDKMKADLVADLQQINDLSGKVDITKEAEDFFEEWYQLHAKDGRELPKLSGYFERRPAHIIKVAMLCHVAYSSDLMLNKIDFEMAIDIVLGTEKRLTKVFENIGKNPYVVDIYRILDYVKQKGRVSREEAKRNFIHAAPPQMLNELIDGLVSSGFLKARVEDMIMYLEVNELMQTGVRANGRVEANVESTK